MRLIASPGSVLSPLEPACDDDVFRDGTDASADVSDGGDAGAADATADVPDATGGEEGARLCLRVLDRGGTALAFYRPREPGEAFTLAGALYGSRDCAGAPIARATLVLARSAQGMDAGTDTGADTGAMDVVMDVRTPDVPADAGAADVPADVPPVDAADAADVPPVDAFIAADAGTGAGG